MGLVSSKDETGRVILGGMPQEVLDYKGRALRDKLDDCLSGNMWYFTVGAILLVLPISVYYRTERPLIAAALMSPIADMQYGTWKCNPEKDAFLEHYHKLKAEQTLAAARLSGQLEQEDAEGKWG